MHRPVKFVIWFPIVMAAVFVVAWLLVREYSKPGPYDLEPVSIVRSGNKNGGEANVNSEIGGWQTYRNEEYGFEFKYPANWELTFNTGSRDDGTYEKQFNIKPVYYLGFEGCVYGQNATDFVVALIGADASNKSYLKLYIALQDYIRFPLIYYASLIEFNPKVVDDFDKVDMQKVVYEITNNIKNDDLYLEQEFVTVLGNNSRHYLVSTGGGPCDVSYRDEYEVATPKYYIDISIFQTNIGPEIDTNPENKHPYQKAFVDQILSTFRFIE